jgi:colanic acid/amylovoran biosynthesis glycosyltransferase
MARMLMIAPAPVVETGDRLRLDVKFVEGMRVQQSFWPSRITVALRRGASAIPFGRDYDRAELPFDLLLLDQNEEVVARHLATHDLIYAGGDDFHCLGLTDHLGPGQKIVYVIEYTHETRMQILNLDRGRGMIGRLKGGFWLKQQEKRRLRAFQAATALQANGYPAHDQYSSICADSLLYLDGRMTPDLFATETEMAAREARLSAGGPLRMIYSGRLETMKGAQDLLPVAQRLTEKGVDFTLDIFGTGALESEIVEGLQRLKEPNRVRLHGALDFETELVPFTRRHADVFLGCHRQADPSCTYIEAMGCGVAIASYDNRMWKRLNAEAKAGWDTPLGRPIMLADKVAELARNPAAITEASRNAWAFSRAHGFLPEFQRRMEHLARVAGLPVSSKGVAASR